MNRPKPNPRLSGHEISLEDLRAGRILTTNEQFTPSYGWSAGMALSRFLRELQRGRLIGRHCANCRRVLVPPRWFCERCYRLTDGWVYLQETGRVNTYSVSYVDADASPLEQPLIVAVIEIDGASPGMGLLHVLGNVATQDVHIGMPVRAVWRRPAERRGAITDIRFFEPLTERS